MFSSVHNWNDVRVFHKEAVSLAKKYNVELHATADFSYKKKQNVNIYGLKPWLKRYERLKNIRELWNRAKKSDADVFHFHDPELIPVGFLLYFLKRKVVYDIHESYADYMLIKSWIPKFLRVLASNIIRFVENMSARFLDAIIVTSKQDYKNFKNFKRKIIIYNFPISKYFKTDSAKDYKSKYDLIYHGSITNYNVKIILNLIEKLKTTNDTVLFCLVVGGYITSNLRKKISAEIKKRNLKNNIEILNKMDYKKIPQYIFKSNIGIIPLPNKKKFRKNIPTKLFEFMLCRKPVIASNLQPIRDFMKKAKPWGILVNPDCQEEYFKAAKNFLTNKKLAKSMGENGYTQAKNKYIWEKEENKLFDLYSELIEDYERIRP